MNSQIKCIQNETSNSIACSETQKCHETTLQSNHQCPSVPGRRFRRGNPTWYYNRNPNYSSKSPENKNNQKIPFQSGLPNFPQNGPQEIQNHRGSPLKQRNRNNSKRKPPEVWNRCEKSVQNQNQPEQKATCQNRTPSLHENLSQHENQSEHGTLSQHGNTFQHSNPSHEESPFAHGTPSHQEPVSQHEDTFQCNTSNNSKEITPESTENPTPSQSLSHFGPHTPNSLFQNAPLMQDEPRLQKQTIPPSLRRVVFCPLCPSKELLSARLRKAFGLEGSRTFKDFGPVVAACGLSHFWRRSLFELAIGPPATDGEFEITFSRVQVDDFVTSWLNLRQEPHRCLDEPALFIAVTSKGLKDCLVADDLVPLVEDVADRQLDMAGSELREPYVDTVVARILLSYGVHLTGILTASSLRVSGFTRLLDILPVPSDPLVDGPDQDWIDKGDGYCVESRNEPDDLPAEFSYDDFLAIFGLYVELTSRNVTMEAIDILDLYGYVNVSVTFLDEVLNVPCVRPFSSSGSELSYPDFVWLTVAVEGKGYWPKSVEYLFRVLDLESDGVVTHDELHYFFQEHKSPLDLGFRKFQDVMCELVDAVRPADPSRFTLLDLRRSGASQVFFAPFVDAPAHPRRWGHHRRRSMHASWWPTGTSGCDLGSWDSFVKERLELIRDTDVNFERRQMEQMSNQKGTKGESSVLRTIQGFLFGSSSSPDSSPELKKKKRKMRKSKKASSKI